MSQQFSGAAAIRAAVMIMGSTYVTYAVGLLVSIVIARHLGPDDFGRYAYVVWMAGILLAIANNGLTSTSIRFVSESLGRKSPDAARRVHGWLLRRQVACMVLVALGFIVAARWLAPDGWEGPLAWFVLVALAAGLSKAVYIFDASIAKGYGRFDVEARATVAMSFLNLVLVLVLVALRAPLIAYLCAFVLVSAGHMAISRTMLRKGGMHARMDPPDPALEAQVRRHLLWTVVLVLAYTFSHMSIETYLLNATVGTAEVGFFAIAAALSRGGVDLLASGLVTVMMPVMAHGFGEGGTARVNEIMANCLRYCLFMGLLLIGVGVLVARPGVLLMYGEQYEAVVFALRVMVVVGGLTLGEAAFNSLLSTTDNQRMRVVFAVLSLVITAGFAFALVPRWGLAGAIASHAASRLLVFALVAALISQRLALRIPWREFLRLGGCALLAGALACALVLAMPGMWTELVAGVVFALLFLAATVVFDAWRASDVAHLLEFLERYPAVHGRVSGPLRRWATGLQ